MNILPDGTGPGKIWDYYGQSTLLSSHPWNLDLLDIFGQVAFFIDIFLQFFVAFRDSQTYKMVFSRELIAIRYLKSHFIFDLLACMPWDFIYTASGRKEEVRYLLLIRLVRARKILDFFSRLEKDIRVKYLFSRIIKLIAIELYCTHTAACIFYYLATTIPASNEEQTWIGSLKLGDYSYSNFREIDLWNLNIIIFCNCYYGNSWLWWHPCSRVYHGLE